MRNSARGILIEDGKILLIHRIKNGDDYYVIPGGGIEKNENLKMSTIRELKEEVGIDVKIIQDKPIMILKQDDSEQFYMLVKRFSGEIGNGSGPEFNSVEYENNGIYKPEMIQIEDIMNNKINLVPIFIKEKLINMINKLDIKYKDINSCDLLRDNSV